MMKSICSLALATCSFVFAACNKSAPPANGGDDGPPAPGDAPPEYTGGPDNRYCGPGDVAMFGGHDGPAALPTACTYTARAATPSPGSIVKVCPRAECDYQDLASAAAAVDCGTTIQIEARDPSTGAQQVYPTNRAIATKTCSADRWITVTTDRIDDPAFPDEGRRITPCWAGKATLHGRPSYDCPASGPGVFVPKLKTTQPNTPVLSVDGASYWRFIGLEIATTDGVNEVQVVTTGTDTNGGDHIILDRVLVHGGDTADGQNATDAETGVSFGNTTHGAVIDSFIYDMICVKSCIDSHGVSLGGNSLRAEGPLKVVGNYIEASGENLFGGGGGSGGDSNCCAGNSDIEVRRNHAFKPSFWQVSVGCSAGDPGCTCQPDGTKCKIASTDPYTQTTKVIVKNNLELKNGTRVLIEGNVFDTNWGGQSDQAGTLVLLGPRNQSRHANGVNVTATSDGTGLLTANKDFFTADVLSSFCATPGHCIVAFNNDNVDYLATQFIDARHIVVTPAPPATTAAPIDQCRPGGNPNAIVQDVVFRANRVRHGSNALIVDTARSTGCGDEARAAARINIHDSVFDDLDGRRWNLTSSACCTWSKGVSISNAYANPDTALNTISVVHNTILIRPSGASAGEAGSLHVTNSCGGTCTTPLHDLELRDNIGAAGMHGHPTKAKTYCAIQNMMQPTSALLDCMGGPSWCFTNNLFTPAHVPDLEVGQDPLEDNLPWPTSSPGCPTTVLAAPADYAGLGFADLHEADGGDYHLTTAFRGLASDGKDPGADIDKLTTATAGVAP